MEIPTDSAGKSALGIVIARETGMKVVIIVGEAAIEITGAGEMTPVIGPGHGWTSLLT